MIQEERKLNDKLSIQNFKLSELTIETESLKKEINARDCQITQLKSVKEQLNCKIDFFKAVYDDE